MKKTSKKPTTKAKTKKTKVKKPLPNLQALYEHQLKNPNDPMSKKIYNRKPSSFSKEEINRLVKGVNDRLYKLEKAGLKDDSRIYYWINEYAINKGNPKNYYNVRSDGTIRVTSDLSRFSTPKEKYDYITQLQNILSAKTSQVGGVNKALRKAYKTFIKNPVIVKAGANNISFEEYKNVWKTYRDNVVGDDKGRYESDDVIDFLTAKVDNNLGEIPKDKLATTMKYYNQNKALYSDMYDFINQNLDMFSDA